MGNSHNEIRGFMGNLPIPSHNPLWEGIHGKFPKALMGISHEIWVNLLSGPVPVPRSVTKLCQFRSSPQHSRSSRLIGNSKRKAYESGSQ